MKSKKEYNELRLLANEIIRQLYEAGELEQILILHIATTRSIEELTKTE
jgi:hypothetical protein